MNTILTPITVNMIEDIVKNDKLYNISDESGEIFINALDLEDAVEQAEDNYISFEVDILVSGDPVREGLIDFTNAKDFEEFLSEFE